MRFYTWDDIDKYSLIALKNGISEKLFKNRIYCLDWEIERASTQPIKTPKISKKELTHEDLQTLKFNKISYGTYYARRRKGWDKDKSVNTPLHTVYESSKKAVNKRRKVPEWVILEGQKIGLNSKVINHRIYRGWSYIEACKIPKMARGGFSDTEKVLKLRQEIRQKYCIDMK